MTKVRTSELIGPALDWAVARAEGADCIDFDNPDEPWLVCGGISSQRLSEFSPSTNWHQGGLRIERTGISISLRYATNVWDALVKPEFWTTGMPGSGVTKEIIKTGPTPLIAAMRAYVTAKLGDKVEIPEELD